MPPTQPRPVKILVVEDHEEDFRFLALLLKRPQLIETYELDWAGSFEEGVERLRDGRYDVGLFDYSLGGGTGLDLLREARARGAEDMPVILLTGVDNPHIDDEALATGAADYLCKVGLNSTQLERSIRYARKQTATLAELRRTSLLLDSALAYLPMIAGRVDADGSIREARGRGLELLAVTEEDLVGVNTLDAWADVAPHIRAALEGGESAFTREVMHDGVRRHFDNYFRFDHARGQGAIGFAVDVTTRVEAEIGRRRQAGLLDSILRNLPVLAGRLDAEGRLIEASGEGLRRHAMAPDELLGRAFADIFPQSRGAIAEALAGGTTSFTLSGFKDDEEWSVDFFVSFDSEQGAGATFFGRDLTERRGLERQLLKISDAEQQRIGADLHDGLGQQLTGLACMAAALRDRLRVKLPEESSLADLVAKIANEATEQSRALARGLSPVQLEAHGVSSALEDLAFQSQRLHNIECRFSQKGPSPQMDHLAAIHLYRIVQESIHNAVRHGCAQRIRIGLLANSTRHRLIILDDGHGFDSRATRADMGRGLRLMQYRANMLGGTLQIRSRLGFGTRVICDWPPISQYINEN